MCTLVLVYNSHDTYAETVTRQYVTDGTPHVKTRVETRVETTQVCIHDTTHTYTQTGHNGNGTRLVTMNHECGYAFSHWPSRRMQHIATEAFSIGLMRHCPSSRTPAKDYTHSTAIPRHPSHKMLT